MEHNFHNLQIGDVVVLDEGFSNSGDVKILDFTPLCMYATVCDIQDTNELEPWEVMTYRLTPKIK